MDGVLAGRVGVVTGASAGIGAAVARALAAAGMRLILGARRASQLEAVCGEIRAHGGAADFVVTDMRDDAQVERLVAAAGERYGRLDALVNNAAMGGVRSVADGRVDEWRAILETNVLGTLIACRAALRFMLPRGHGDILNVTSPTAHEAWPYMSAYAASKAGIEALSRCLRVEVGRSGVRVMILEVHNVGGTEAALHFDPALSTAAIRRWGELGLLNLDAPPLERDDVARAAVFQLSQAETATIHHLTVRPRAD
ncbi:MAG: SDR family oxidoreductase [Candidatus Binatia bacterium]